MRRKGKRDLCVFYVKFLFNLIRIFFQLQALITKIKHEISGSFLATVL